MGIVFHHWRYRHGVNRHRTQHRAGSLVDRHWKCDSRRGLRTHLKYPAIAQSWRRNWDLVIPFFAFPEGVRKIIYTTNAIEALNSKLRRAIRTRGHFPSDDAAAKLLYLVLNHAAADWKRPPREWFEAKTQFAVMFKERFVLA